ncbi:hypothetical protein ABPG72_003889 [Tetrahymena utriculariae]
MATNIEIISLYFENVFIDYVIISDKQLMIQNAQIQRSVIPDIFLCIGNGDTSLDNFYVDIQSIFTIRTNFIVISYNTNFNLTNSKFGIVKQSEKNEWRYIHESYQGFQYYYQSISKKKKKYNRFYHCHNKKKYGLIFLQTLSVKIQFKIFYGGAIYIPNSVSTNINIENLTINSCSSGIFGGAIYSNRILNMQNVTIKNCKSKIGGGLFTFQKSVFQNVNFINNTAIISSPDFYTCEVYPDLPGTSNSCNIFEFHSMYQFNQVLQDTPFYLIEVGTYYNRQNQWIPNQIQYETILNQGSLYVMRLKVKYLDVEINDFTSDQKLGNSLIYQNQISGNILKL